MGLFDVLRGKRELKQPAPDGQRVLRGNIVSVGDVGETFTIEADGKLFEVALADVDAANLAFELHPHPKKASNPKKGAHHHKSGNKKRRSSKQ